MADTFDDITDHTTPNFCADLLLNSAHAQIRCLRQFLDLRYNRRRRFRSSQPFPLRTVAAFMPAVTLLLIKDDSSSAMAPMSVNMALSIAVIKIYAYPEQTPPPGQKIGKPLILKALPGNGKLLVTR